MYNLHQLGWYGFQQLSLTIAREVLGQTSMSFLASADGGRDGSFSGKWKKDKKETIEGQFVFQCKFSGKPNYNLKYSDLKDEFEKVEKLVKSGLCDIYILITNAGVSGNLAAKIERELKDIGVKYVIVWGSDWLSQTINENMRLRRLVPRLYGLGDLSQILDERVYLQGKSLLESLKDELAKVVITNAYQKAAEALDKYGFVLLIGEPAAGKTTIASLLAMGALDQWHASTLKLDTADQVIKHWNPDDPAQFFWIDDAFGVTQYETNLVHKWNHVMPQIKAMIKNGSKIVMTSRDYIYNRARNDLKESAFPKLKESQVVIDVHDLTLTEKKQILYNHIKMGTQPQAFRKEIKPHLDFIASLKRFIPETARRIASPFFTKNLVIWEWHLEDFVNKQESFLVEVLGGLDNDSQAALALIYMNNDNLSSPLQLKPHEVIAIERIGSTLGGCTNALNAMKGNLVQTVYIEDNLFWKFKHPTVGDAFSLHVVQSPELIEIYLQGSPVDKLIDQVTCGDVGLEKAVIVPRLFFPLMLSRLKSYTTSKNYKSQYLAVWGAKRKIHEFLSFRCSDDFLALYVEQNPGILEDVVMPGLSLDAVSEVDLSFKLFQSHLLPEENRKIFVKQVSNYAIKGEDLFALKSEKIQTLFTKEELIELKTQVKEQLFPTISNLTNEWQSKYDDNEDIEDYIDPLIDMYRILREEFEEEADRQNRVDQEIEKLKDWVIINRPDERNYDSRESLANESISPIVEGERSIFDDIDLN